MVTHSNLQVEMFAENFNLESEVELEVWNRVKFAENSHDCHGPGIGRFEHATIGTRLKHFSNKWHNIEKLLKWNKISD